ncbi:MULTISPECIES: hypothetical protein [Pontibacillus]|uniref:Uncharacterized protein n=1 Tax=Pontibacillus chungwhensis TaxID=265426 RepID=A0ABY8V4V5_9BACI|nr:MULTISPECIES: hypothetical protein [Pontibacillus]MCD5322335.1 hypothetical protein [Pontibacillus sp. HN14]WIF99625.1 hypothetical protein QNI29_08200 [Pontibacillus chungwhensis]
MERISFIQMLSARFDEELVDYAERHNGLKEPKVKNWDPMKAEGLYELMRFDWKQDEEEVWSWILKEWQFWKKAKANSNVVLIRGSKYFQALHPESSGMHVWWTLFDEIVLEVLRQKVKWYNN